MVFWAKTIRDEFRHQACGEIADPGRWRPSCPRQDGIAQASVVAGLDDGGDEDEELSAYNAYLARLNAEVKDHGRWHGLR